MKNIPSIYQKNVVKKKPTWFILNRRKRKKRHYVLIKDFNTFMYDYTLHRGRKHFCHFCRFILETALKLNDKPKFIMHKKDEYVK